MEFPDSLIPVTQNSPRTLAALDKCNAFSGRFGLILTEQDAAMLVRAQSDSLRDAGRVEFGEGPYRELIQAFCDSQYLAQESYADTLAGLCELFYQFKSESLEEWSDEELIAEMRRLYDACWGSLDLLGDRLWESFHRSPEYDDETELVVPDAE